MTENTDEQAIRDMLAAITPGPWEWTDRDMILFQQAVGDENATFIAAAPAIVADLLGEVDRLRGELAAVRELHKPYSSETERFEGCVTCGYVWPCATALLLGVS